MPCINGTIRFDIEQDILGLDAEGEQAPSGYLAQRRRDSRHRRASGKTRTIQRVYDRGVQLKDVTDHRPLPVARQERLFVATYWEGALTRERAWEHAAVGSFR